MHESNIFNIYVIGLADKASSGSIAFDGASSLHSIHEGSRYKYCLEINAFMDLLHDYIYLRRAI